MDFAQNQDQDRLGASVSDAAAAFDDFGAAAAGQSAELNGPAAHPMLRWGSRGEAVNECQRKLNLHGAELVEDGDFGPATNAAVRRFQGESGLAVDGVVGPMTWGALDEGLAAQPTKADTPGLTEVQPSGPGQALVGAHQTAPAAAGSGDNQLDDAALIGKLLMADTSEFSGYVSSGVLSPVLANVLALMRDLGGDTQYSYELAKDGLSDGTLLGLVYNSQRDSLLARRLAPTDPDRAEFATLAATNTGAVFANNTANTRGLILVGDGHTGSTRALVLDLSHELLHYRNEAVSDVIQTDPSQDIADAPTGPTADQIGETRRIYVDEVCARHVEWWAAWTVRQERVGGQVTDVDAPEPARLYTACVDLATNFMANPIYDPHGYWEALILRGDDSLERQVGQWLTFVQGQTLSGNPYRDMLSKLSFAQAAALRTASGRPDGLGGDID